MDDTAAGIVVGLLTALVLHGSMSRRAARAAERQVRESFTGTGSIHAVVREQAPFGILGNDLWAIDIFGDHVSADTVPFTQIHRPGWKGSIHHLRLHLTDCGIRGMQISRLDADIPSVTYDLGHALYKDRLLIRGAGTGTVRISIDQSNLEAFAQRKYGKTLRSVKAALNCDHISITGELKLMNAGIPFTVEGQISQRAGRYLDIVDPVVTLNGASVDALQAKSLLDRINPVLDVKTDLHLEQVIRVQHVSGVGNQLIIDGDIYIPAAQIQGHEKPVSAADLVSPAP